MDDSDSKITHNPRITIPQRPVTRQLAYLAHPLNAEDHAGIQRNRHNAALWGAWLVRECGLAVAAPWLWLSTVWDESEANRNLGLECNKATIELCSAVVMTGGRVSTGMGIEREYAISIGVPVVYLTWFGYYAPNESDDMKQLQTARNDVLRALNPNMP